jgi:hypothetical protein
MVLQNAPRVAHVAGGHTVVVAAFAVFVVANGGVVVGDRSAHAPALHLAQVPYCAAFVAGALAPTLAHHCMCASAVCHRYASACQSRSHACVP